MMDNHQKQIRALVLGGLVGGKLILGIVDERIVLEKAWELPEAPGWVAVVQLQPSPLSGATASVANRELIGPPSVFGKVF